MFDYTVSPDSTDISVVIRIVDSDGHTPETGVVYNTSGIDIQYRREGETNTAITEADLATPALDDPHLDGGFLEIGNGYYRVDLPDAAVASGASGVLVHGTVTGMIVIGAYIHLNDVDVSAINASTSAAANLALGADSIETGQAITGTLSSSAMTTDLSETTDDHYVGRTVVWTSGVLAKSRAVITSYNGTTKTVTYSGGTATGEAPSNGDDFIIV